MMTTLDDIFDRRKKRKKRSRRRWLIMVAAGFEGVGGGGNAEPAIRLSADSIDEDASVGDLVGILSVVNGSGTYAFTLTDDAGGKFALDGVDDTRLEVAGALNYEAATGHNVTVEADNGVDDPIVQVLSIGVTNVVEDTTPAAFSFVDVTGAALSTVYESNAITVSGIDGPATLTITGGQYQINGGAWASSATTANAGDSVKVRGTSSGSYSTAVNVTPTIGGVSDTFTITTEAGAGGGYTPSLDFSDARNSMYVPTIGF